jgi:hypothetical protein
MRLALVKPTGSLIAAFVSIFAASAYGQEPPSTGRLIPGSADVLHDVLGIAIGMPCDQAIAKARGISADASKYWRQNLAADGTVRLDGNRIDLEYKYLSYEVQPRVINSIAKDFVSLKCLKDGGVFEIARRIAFEPKLEQAPSIAALRGMFQEKYGVPTSEFSPFLFATMFNRHGVIQGRTDACGPYGNGSFILKDFYVIDSNKCSYALTFQAIEGRGTPGSIVQIDIVIRDYLRVENAVRALVKQRLEMTPVAAPKL